MGGMQKNDDFCDSPNLLKLVTNIENNTTNHQILMQKILFLAMFNNSGRCVGLCL